MGLQDFFPKKLAKVEGKDDEYVTLSRAARTNTVKSINTVFNALLKNNTKIANGDLLTCGDDRYFVAAMRKTFINTVCQVHKVNCVIDIVRAVPVYVNEKRTGDTEEYICKSPAIQTTVTAAMRMYDAGLGANVVKRILLPVLGIKELDRVKLGCDNYQIDSIDDSSYEGLLYCQCSVDKRSC